MLKQTTKGQYAYMGKKIRWDAGTGQKVETRRKCDASVTHAPIREGFKKNNGGKCDHFPSWPPPPITCIRGFQNKQFRLM